VSAAVLDKRSTPPALPAPLITEALAGLEKALGGRDHLVAALAHAPKSKSVDYLLGLLGDPGRASESLAQLCATGGITAGELIDAYKAGQLNRAQAISLKDMDTELPKVVADTLRMALPHQTVCPICDGATTIPGTRTRQNPSPPPEKCVACNATGTQQLDGDLEHKKLVMEIAQLTAKGGGVNVNVSQQTALVFGGAAGGALERLQLATDQILYGDGANQPPLPEPSQAAYTDEVVEAEVLVPSAEASVEVDWQGQEAEDA